LEIADNPTVLQWQRANNSPMPAKPTIRVTIFDKIVAGDNTIFIFGNILGECCGLLEARIQVTTVDNLGEI
jgi:hypothetical protein